MHFSLGDTQDAQATRRQNAVTLGVIALAALVRAAIYLYDQAPSMAVEVDDEAIDHLLASEV